MTIKIYSVVAVIAFLVAFAFARFVIFDGTQDEDSGVIGGFWILVGSICWPASCLILLLIIICGTLGFLLRWRKS